MTRPPPTSTLFPYTTLFRSKTATKVEGQIRRARVRVRERFLEEIKNTLVNNLSTILIKDLQMSILGPVSRSEEHTSELQSQSNLVCRLLLEKKNKNKKRY